MLLDYGIVSVDGFDVSVRGIVTANLDHGIVHLDGFDVDSPALAELDHVSMHLDAYDASGVAGSLGVQFLKAEFCRFEENFKTLKVRIKIHGVYHQDKDNIFTAKIVTSIIDPENAPEKLEFPLDTWTQTVGESTTKLIKEYDLNLVTFLDGRLPLNIGKHTLEVSLNGTVTSGEFSVVPMTVQTMKSKYLLGIELQSRVELVLQQELRLITGVEVTQISNDTPVGAKELVWNAADSTLQWDNGEPVLITDEYFEYRILNYMSTPGVTDGDYITVIIEDIDNLSSVDQTEVVIVDVKNYDVDDYQYWIQNGVDTLVQTIIQTEIEPTLYSSDKDLGYKYLDPVMDIPKSRSESSNYSFDLTVNMLQDIIELWAAYYGSESRINISSKVLSHTNDGRVVLRSWPGGFTAGRAASGSVTATIGLSGKWDRTIHAKSGPGDRNKTQNFWNATVISGIIDPNLRALALDVSARISSIMILLQAGLGKGAGIASRSFSVGGISSSYSTTESAENSLYSGVLTDLQRGLGVGKSSAAEQRVGLINQLKNKVLGDSLGFKM